MVRKGIRFQNEFEGFVRDLHAIEAGRKNMSPEELTYRINLFKHILLELKSKYYYHCWFMISMVNILIVLFIVVHISIVIIIIIIIIINKAHLVEGAI